MAVIELTGTMTVGGIFISIKSAADYKLAETILKEKDKKDFDIKAFCDKNKLTYK